ncbi:O-antigen ligase family protein [Rariglobus hedericola]|uniref:O-antigen ligase family protein n=1 Tax=Rariglobus hedericola TaxID=2597822 RepID=A0A556QQM6_9BACT|nr:O-antigen ligase family protein [Rariglobus hedericola]TSJ78944.1 O-antigen ligase family protein [Rariglobus hedericola]
MPPSRPPRTASPSADSSLQAFRGDLRAATGLHPLETTVVVITGVLLCFMPWAFGTMAVWSQLISLGLALSVFVVALINRHYRGHLAPEGDFKLIMWPKLVRFPLFWLGLVFLGYILTQALNPAWTYMTEDRVWWLDPTEHISWLPAGMKTPFADMNPWRVLLIYSAAWLLGSALWVGITRRAAVQLLFTVIVSNGAVFAIIGILQNVTGAKYVLWSLKGVNNTGNFFATIIYKNHAGAYLNLVLMLCTGLLYWHFSRAERRMERTSPAPVFGFFGVLLGIGVLLTGSRAATLLLMAFTLIAFIGFIVRCTLYRSEGRSPWVITVLCAVFALFIGLGAYFLNTGQAFDRIGQLLESGKSDSSVSSRLLARQATWEMAQDNIVTGWGAGSFRHYFPVYQRNYQEIYTYPGRPDLKFRWEYAHNDYVQLLAELGLIGAGILLAMLVCGAVHLIRKRVYLKPHLMFIVLALVITAAHAWVDFPFQNPAILMLWCASAALVGRWAELEARSARR